MMNEKLNNIEIKKVNRSRIFRWLYTNAKLSKQDIAAQLNMSLPTVNQNLKSLLEQDLIEEDGTFESTGGRRAKAISYKRSARYAVGLDITKFNVVIVVIDLGGQAVCFNRVKLPFANTDAYFQSIGELVSQSISKSQIDTSKILGVGIAVPAIVSEDKMLASYATILGFTGGTCGHFSRYIPYPCILCNDANAGGFAEMWNTNNTKNVIYLSVSNSVGGSIFIDKKLYPGENQRCSEIGHMTIVPHGRKCYCEKEGCVDAYCNVNVLASTHGGNISGFFQAVKEKSAGPMRIWEEYLDYLAITINNLRMLFDCNVILGGYLGVYMDEHIDHLRSILARHNTFEFDGSYLQVCKYKFEAAAVGAALMYIEEFINQI